MLNAEWRDGLLVADHNVGLPTDSDAHARWYEFDVTGSPTLLQDGTISPAPGTSTYFPAIAIAPGRRDRPGVQPVVADRVCLGLRHGPHPGRPGGHDGNARAGQGRDGDLFRLRLPLG